MKLEKYLKEYEDFLGKDFTNNDNPVEFIKSIAKQMDNVHKRFSSFFKVTKYPFKYQEGILTEKQWKTVWNVYKDIDKILEKLDEI